MPCVENRIVICELLRTYIKQIGTVAVTNPHPDPDCCPMRILRRNRDEPNETAITGDDLADTTPLLLLLI